jgi:hypothetical protein
MSNAAANVIRLELRRAGSPARSRRIARAAAVFALCLLGLIGSFADSAVARTGLLLIGPTDDAGGSLDNVAATLIWATIANLAACAGVVMIAYWLLTRPSAQIVALRARRRDR